MGQNMEPFAHLGARALNKLKGIIPQSAPPEPAGPPPPSPGVPPWAAPTGSHAPGEVDPHVGMPNIPYLDDSPAVTNDDPNANIRMQLGAIDPKTTPSVLHGLQAAGMDDVSKTMALQDKLRDDTAMNLSKAKGAGSTFMTGATPEHMRQLDSDLAPLDQYRAQKQDFADKQYQAGLGGFKSPQDAAAFARMLETKKVTSPSDVAGIQAEGNLKVQEARDKGYEGFFDKLMGMNAAGMPPGLTLRGPGGVGITSAPVSPGASAAAEKSIEQLNKELTALQNPSVFNYANPDMYTGQRDAMIKAKKAELAAAQARATGHVAPVETSHEDPRRTEATRLLTEAGQPVTEANINHVMQQLH